MPGDASKPRAVLEHRSATTTAPKSSGQEAKGSANTEISERSIASEHEHARAREESQKNEEDRKNTEEVESVETLNPPPHGRKESLDGGQGEVLSVTFPSIPCHILY